MAHRLPSSQLPLAVGLCLLLAAATCPSTNNGKDAGSGSTDRLCTLTTDCNEFEECVGGICQRPCGTDDVCEFGQFCNASGYCQVGCRDTESCPNPTTELCVEGICRDRMSVGTCATKADCVTPPDTNICKEGSCVAPPATCAGPQDCPGAGQCNGFTHACFNPNGECMMAGDCAGKAQCTNGCTCTMDRRCVPTPVCTLANEATVCGVGSYCDTNQMPNPRCAPAPACQGQPNCDASHLACNHTTTQCERSPTCTTDANCTAPFTKCNTSAGYCQEPNCLNGGLTCTAPTTCSATTGTCTGGGTTCTTNSACPPAQYCSTGQTCLPGCRTDANCNASIGEKCNGAHACAVPSGSSSSGGGGGGMDGAPCTSDTECSAAYGCSTVFNVCRERCSSANCPPCPLTGMGCFELLPGFGGLCSPLTTPPDVDAGCP